MLYRRFCLWKHSEAYINNIHKLHYVFKQLEFIHNNVSQFFACPCKRKINTRGSYLKENTFYGIDPYNLVNTNKFRDFKSAH